MFCNVKSTAAACKCSSVIICIIKYQCLNRKSYQQVFVSNIYWWTIKDLIFCVHCVCVCVCVCVLTQQ